jgi:hypothetical protein
MTVHQGRNLFRRATVLIASVGAMAATLVAGSAGMASASSVPGHDFELCAHGTFATDVWVNGSLFMDVPPQSPCVTKVVPIELITGPQYYTFHLFVHNATPGIKISDVTYDIHEGMGIVVNGTPHSFTWSEF